MLRVTEHFAKSLNVTETGTIRKFGYSPSTIHSNYMALSCIISQTKRDIGRKSAFLHTLLHSTPPLGGPVGMLLYRLV